VTVCCRCSKELNQWEVLTEYGNAKGNTNSHLVLESAWRQQNYWAVVKDAVSQVTFDVVSQHCTAVALQLVITEHLYLELQVIKQCSSSWTHLSEISK